MRLIRSDSRETLGRLIFDVRHIEEQARDTDSPPLVVPFPFPLYYSVECAGNIMVAAPITLRNCSITFDLGPV